MKAAGVLLIVGAFGWSGCATGGGTLRDEGFTHELNVYAVDGSPSDFIPGGRWRVANFFISDGRLRSGFDKRVKRKIDVNDDGDWDYRWEGFEYDLVLDSVSDGGRIAFTSMAVSGIEGRKDIGWFAEQFAAELSGTREVTRLLADTAVQTRGRRYGTRYVSSGPVVIDGTQAHKLVVDVFDADSAQGNNEGHSTRLAIVMSYMPLSWPQEQLAAYKNEKGHTAVRGVAAGSMRLVLLVTCANDSTRFSQTESDCESVLGQIRFKR